MLFFTAEDAKNAEFFYFRQDLRDLLDYLFSSFLLPTIALAQARPPAKQARRTGEAGGDETEKIQSPSAKESMRYLCTICICFNCFII